MITGLALLSVHSIAALIAFRYCWAHWNMALVESLWRAFDFLDWPLVPLTLHFRGPASLMLAISHHGHELIGSAPKLRAAVLAASAGGLQWLIIGAALGAGYKRYRRRMGHKAAVACVSVSFLLLLGISQAIARWWDGQRAMRLMAEPLNAAARQGRSDTARLLLVQGKDINTRGFDAVTPFMSAMDGEQIDVAMVLIEHGAEVDARNKYGITALESAVCRENLDVVRFLLDHHANIRDGKALIAAASVGRAHNVRLLLEHGANAKAKDSDGETALMHAAFSAGRRQGDFAEILALLIEHGADVHAKDSSGVTALGYLMVSKDPDPNLIAMLKLK